MSKFFRRLPDSDSSSSASDSEDLEENQNDQNSNDLSGSSGLDLATPPVQDEASNAVAVAGPNKDLLLHALLEEKCLNDVRKEHAGRSTSEAAIVIEARNRYQALSSRLAQVGLTVPGFDSDSHSGVRQQYRDGLDAFSKAGVRPGSSTANIRPPARRMLTSAEHVPGLLDSKFENLQLTMPNSIPMSLGPYIPQASMFGTRYRQDFEELGILGKGGYGIVYSCRHKLDGVIYAVKKVPVSESRRQQIMIRGQPEIDALLAELRTLAQLDHPNIVRYYNGWLDYINLDAPLQDSSSADAVAGAEPTRTGSISLGRVITETGDDHIMFEDSGVSRATTNSTASKTSNTTGSENDLRRTASHATRATVSDEDVESISRNNSSSSMLTGTDGPQFSSTTPQLAVHMQMALYPMTLTDFLSQEPPSQPSTSAAPPLKHCFHLAPSIRILLAILDGIAYLHHHRIVHRDLKPGNIFLAPNSDPRHPDGSVDLFLCVSCRAESKANPISLRVRIGDFGLVTALAQDGDGVEGGLGGSDEERGKPVGTELYRPAAEEERGNASPALDVFAAGVVAVELLWPFGTRMERHETLNALKKGQFPPRFGEKVGEEMQACIRDMLRPETPGIDELKCRLVGML